MMLMPAVVRNQLPMMRNPSDAAGTNCATIATQTGDHQLTDTLQAVAWRSASLRIRCAGIVRKFGAQRQNQERAGTQHHTNGEFHRHRQRIAHPVIDSGQNRAADTDPEWVQRPDTVPVRTRYRE